MLKHYDDKEFIIQIQKNVDFICQVGILFQEIENPFTDDIQHTIFLLVKFQYTIDNLLKLLKAKQTCKN